MRGMKRGFRRCAGAGLILAALCISFTAAAQNSPSQGGKYTGPIVGGFDKVRALPPGAPTPRMADGHPDLTGRYYPNHAGRMLEGAYPIDRTIFRQYDPKETPEEPPVFKPGMAAKYKSAVPYGTCDQAGTPSSITMQESQHAPIELIQSPGRLVVLAEYPLTVRMIHTDGRPHPKDPDPSFNGDSTAHWQGDTLVVDVIAIDERMRNVGAGFLGEGGAWLHSDQEHIVERFTRPSKNYLIYQVTIEDPIVLAKPWSSAPRYWSLAQDPNDDWTEVFCTHNEEPEEYEKIMEHDAKASGK
jgi:hypothetical protein